jgi:hypothetical protein
MEIGFSQGDGVWLAEGSLTDQHMRDLTREFVPIEGVDYAITGRKYSTVETQYDWGTPDEDVSKANSIAEAANRALSDFTSDSYRDASDYILDASSEEAWLEWSESMGALYDGSGRLLSTASRKTAMPSDDLIDVDIDDYYGGEEGPDPDSQSGHAETALPYAGDDMTPAFSETGWTKARRKRAARKTAGVKSEVVIFKAVEDATPENLYSPNVMWNDKWTVAEMPQLADMDYDDIIDEFELELEELSDDPRLDDDLELDELELLELELLGLLFDELDSLELLDKSYSAPDSI